MDEFYQTKQANLNGEPRYHIGEKLGTSMMNNLTG